MHRDQLIIFTDLDGTLLDHNTYSYFAAASALQNIASNKIPLIINSSKTFAEIVDIQADLSIHQPFICENGAAVYVPVRNQSYTEKKSWSCQAFVSSRTEVITVVKMLRAQFGFQFTGFSDCDDKGIGELTGLSSHRSKLAGQREFSEPLFWRDSEENKIQFIALLHEKNLIAQQGGRFLSVMQQANKADAMQWLCQYLRPDLKPIVIALGDSPNDEEMLNAADIAVVVKSERSGQLNIVGPKKVIRTDLSGPAGWQKAIDKIFADLSALQQLDH